MLRKLQSWLALATIPILATCGGEVVGVGETIRLIDVTPGNPAITALNITQQFTATARDQDGKVLSGKSFTWHSTAPSVATVDPTTGITNAAGNGSATITATAEGVSGSATLTIAQVATSLTAATGSPTLTALGAATTLSATAFDASGSPVTNAHIQWNSLEPSVLNVSSAGLATAVSNGTGLVVASVAALADTVVIDVTQVTSQLGFSTQPATAVTSGVVFSQQPVVQLLDANGNNVGETGIPVIANLAAGNGTLSGTSTVSTDATGQASFTDLGLSGSGAQTLTFTVTGVASINSNTITVTSGATDPTRSTASLAGNAPAGNPVSMAIQARDASGNPVTVGGDQVVVAVTGANPMAPSVTDNGNGIYSAFYTPTIAGTDNVAITMNGGSIDGSPFATVIAPGPLNASNSEAVVPNGGVGNSTSITVRSRDSYGNTVPVGGGNVSVTVTGANTVNVPVVDNADGTYAATYTPNNDGTDNVAIAMNGIAVSGSPFTSIVAAGNADPTRSSASATTSATAGDNVTVTIATRDASGNALTTGGEVVSVSVSGANVASPVVTDVGDGSYSATYTPTQSGTDEIRVTLNGAEISGSPYAIAINPGAVDGAQSSATVPAAGTANVSTPIVITARDAFGNQQTSGGETVVVVVSGANSATPTVLDEGTGRYATSYTPLVAGSDNVAITINDIPLVGSPFSTNVETGGPDPAQSTASVSASVVAGTASTMVVTARDVSGNALTAGGASVSVQVTGANPASPSVTDRGDGTYAATYTPTVMGGDIISISMNGSPIGGGPYAVTVIPATVDPAVSSATVPGGVLAGSPIDISVTSRDAFGNPLTSGGATVVVTVSGSNTASPTIVDNGDGTYTTSYTPATAGTDNLAITIDGSPISGSPFSTIVSSGAADPAQTSATVPAAMAAGGTVSVSVLTRDGSGNSLTTGGEFVSVSVSGANASSPVVSDNGDGTYSATYTPTVSGTDMVVVSLNGTGIGNSPFTITVNPGNAVGAFSTATVPQSGTSAGTTNIVVQARDGFGNAVLTGGAAVDINVTGANAAAPAVTDVGDGTYTASYTPVTAGPDQIAITLNGVSVSGSPFTSTVNAGNADAAQSSASVQASVVAGSTSSIIVQTRDANGNALTSGGQTVVVTVAGSNAATPAVTDNGNGTYAATYLPTNSGSDNVTVALNGVALNGSPFTTAVEAGDPDPDETMATVPDGTAGNPTAISVQARDAFGNDLTTGGATLTIVVTGANNATPIVSDAGDGTYSASYTPGTTGIDNVAVSMNGEPLGDSPFTSTVAPGAIDPTQSTAVVPASGSVGNATTISIQARDGNGNALTLGGANVVVTISGANSTSPLVVDEADGTYTASYSPAATGTDNVTITVNASHIDGSPFTTTVSAGAPEASETTAEVPGSGTAGSNTTITVTARDENGNVLAVGGASVVVSVAGVNTANPTVTDNGDGTYSTTYIPTTSGTDNVAITMNGVAIGGSPFTTVVSHGAIDASASTATVPAGVAGAATDLTIQGRDSFGNTVLTGGATVAVSVSGANAAAPPVSDVGDGTYTASYTPTTTGSDDIVITVNGDPISGSPFGSVVAPGSAEASQTTATVPTAGASDVETEITVLARDGNGNALTTGGATVVVTVTGANDATPPVTDEGNGTYTASYTPTAVGTDNVAITLNGAPISGSPFSSTVTAGGVDADMTTATVPSAGTTGQTTEITVQARDANGNPLTSGGSTVAISISGANTANPVVTDEDDGTYTASYTPTATGTDNIAITLGGAHISGSPYSSTVSPGEAEASQSTGNVPDGSIGEATAIEIQARDANGNAVTEGGETVFITVSGSNSATPTVNDAGDGTYTASYTPTVGGNDNVAITLNGTPINGSPFTSFVAGGVDPAQSTATVPGAGTPGVETSITVQARDAGGNPITTGGETVVITVTGANSATPTVTDVGNGTYTASYSPANVGPDNIAITMNGLAISGSAFSSIVSVDSESDPANTFAIIPNGTPGEVTTLVVRARNSADEDVTIGGGTVVMSITGTNAASPSVTDNGDGTYTATYTPGLAGSDMIGITLSGTPIEGSPYSSTVSEIAALIGKISYERKPSEFDDNADVIVMNEDGTDMVNLTNNMNFSDERPGISPDGTRIVFNSDRDGDMDIYVMNSNGSNVVQLTNAPGRDRLPVWSPDGAQILFLSERDGDPDIYVISADGTGETALTVNSVDDYQADWSPDGTQIAFYASDDGDFEVFTMNADGSNRAVLLDLPASREVEVSWGLGGIAFISDMDTGGFPNRTQIYKVQPDGTGLTRLTDHDDWDFMPEWSADGTRIVFVTGRDSNGGEIYTMDADGTNQTRITFDSGAEWAPKFQP